MLNLSVIKKTVLSATMLGLSSIATAQTSEYIVTTDCLAKKLETITNTMASDGGYQLLQVPSMAMEDVAHLAKKNRACGGFYNASHKVQFSTLSADKKQWQRILNQYKPARKQELAIKKDEYKIAHREEVNALIQQVDKDKIWQTLSDLTAFQNRSSKNDNGVDAANWIQSKVDAMANEYGRNDVKTYKVDTIRAGYVQPSVVMVLGSTNDDPAKDKPAVVLGAHMDTLTRNENWGDRLPGADDDGSGSSSLMEVARVLLSSKKPLNRPVYLVWYAAEEYGLYGSQSVVADFVKKNIPVKAVLQMDMTGYRHNGSSKIWMITDHVDNGLTNYVGELAREYAGVEVGLTRCGYACSDHASWDDRGFTAAFPVEARFGDEDPYIHSSQDTMDHVSPEHMANFARLGLGFAVELAS